jgi:hypothetical protein
MTKFMLDKTNVTNVIRSCGHLSACGMDGISSRIMTGAGTEGVDLMKLFVKGWIQSRRVINTWKEGKTIL